MDVRWDQATRDVLAMFKQWRLSIEDNKAQIKAQITTLCAVVTELTHHTTANNVLAMPSRRHRDA
ncbi:hypothetical protein AB0H34_08285 [Saccharopolyspora shandongensis]|uniref:hypothetical protein n=1 Tax=Saccharopolyspora shandongensis TaxID=418495 RepID=UPI00340BA45E